MEIDTTSSLFEHILNRLPTGYGLGDDGKEMFDGISNHATFQQSLREDHEGDVGIFETLTSQVKVIAGAVGWNTKVQIAVVTKQGDIDNAYKYLIEAFENIKKRKKSTSISVYETELISIMPIGKNSSGYQMVSMNLSITYTN